MEFIHHEYMMATQSPDKQYVFVLPESFNELKGKLEWPLASNVIFDLFPDKLLEQKSVFPIEALANSWRLCRILKRYVLKYDADYVINNHLMTLLPFVSFFLPKKTRVIGILYRIYLYNLENMPFYKRMLNKIKYSLMSKGTIFYRIFILNDECSASRFNRMFNTTKFLALPDPYTPIPKGEDINLRKDLSISPERKLFVHFGAMARRKGTLQILDSLSLLNNEEKSSYAFVFAGKIASAIKQEFYEKIGKIKDSVQVIVKDEFCSYEFLGALCRECDVILCPYLDTSLSSGLIGYAAQFRKPVIAPASGLIGKLVKDYKIGTTITRITPEELHNSYKTEFSVDISSLKAYCEKNNVDNFIGTIKRTIE